MILDAHVHCSGQERQDDVVRVLDEAGIDMAVLLAAFLTPPYSLADADSLRAANTHLARLMRGRKDRLRGFAVVNPVHGTALEDCRHALEELQLDGVKMVPAGWFPHEDCARSVFDYVERIGCPMLFHSGIFIDGVSGRFCRPVEFEALRDFPALRVTLAHLGWPWSDEAIAVGLIDRIKGVAADDCQFRFDLSFGAPPVYRLEMLRKALAVLGPELLQFGSDCFLPCEARDFVGRRHELTDLLGELDTPRADIARIMAGTACAWLKLPER